MDGKLFLSVTTTRLHPAEHWWNWCWHGVVVGLCWYHVHAHGVAVLALSVVGVALLFCLAAVEKVERSRNGPLRLLLYFHPWHWDWDWHWHWHRHWHWHWHWHQDWNSRWHLNRRCCAVAWVVWVVVCFDHRFQLRRMASERLGACASRNETKRNKTAQTKQTKRNRLTTTMSVLRSMPMPKEGKSTNVLLSLGFLEDAHIHVASGRT